MLEVKTEQIEISASEKKDLLDLVEEQQSLRATRHLTGKDVPAVLLPYQIRWHKNESEVRIAVKSRRIGFSWGCLAAEGALEAARQNGMNQYYMGYNIGMAAENIGDALFFARAYGLACSNIDISREREVIGDKKQDISRFRLKFASGWVYEALSSSPWNWRGRQGHARIDEAAFHKNLTEVIKGAMAFRMWGGRVDIISTLNGEDNYFYELYKEVKAGKLSYSLHEIDFDQAIKEGLYKRICLVKGWEWTLAKEKAWRDAQYASYANPEDALEELSCIPKRGSGAYFSRLLLEQCMIDDVPLVRWSKPADWVTSPTRLEEAKKWIIDTLKPVIDAMTGHRTVYGQDFGRIADLSVIWLMQEREPRKWTQALMLELRNIPFDVQALIRDWLLDNIPLFHHAAFDAGGNGASHAEGAKQRYGTHKVTEVKITAQFYADNFPKYKQLYEDRSYLIIRSEDVIADHRNIIMVKGRPTMSDARIKGSDGEFRHGDSAIAGLMTHTAIQAESETVPALEFVNFNWLKRS